MRYFTLIVTLLLLQSNIFAQVNDKGQKYVGIILGAVVDTVKKEKVAGAGIQVLELRQTNSKVLSAVATHNNGEFEINNLPVGVTLKLIISNIGFQNKEFTFQLTDKDAQEVTTGDGDGSHKVISKDFGKIVLVPSTEDLDAVVVQSRAKQLFEMGMDRKIFNVDQNISSSGQSAQEVMRNIPSLNVDIDGNLTFRNATPQIFVDGRPTTLTLDQIPSDLIEKVELISNPSAKYDASGGGGGIVNIVMKTNKRVGYNGGIRSGVDTRGAYNMGGDINVKQGKFNVFANGMYRQRRSRTTSSLDRNSLTNNIGIDQNGKLRNKGYFAMMNLGTDYFMDNHNTFSISGSLSKGQFNNTQHMFIDSLDESVSVPFTYGKIDASGKNKMDNKGGKFSYKHNFQKSGHDISFDANYRSTTTDNNSITQTRLYSDPQYTISKYPDILQKSNGNGFNKFLTLQSDYENPITESSKIEAGVRAAIRKFESNTYNYTDSTGIGTDALIFRPTISSKYKFDDKVFAAYVTFSSKIGEALSYQLGLRGERSDYKGDNTWLTSNGADSTTAHFRVKYPVNLFPSAFVTYALGNHQDLQLNYTRKVNRPSFFQLLPTPDVTDPQNIKVGNPELKPEFSNNFELSYDNKYGRNNSFMATAYFRYTTNLMTGYQYIDSSYTNAPGGYAIVNTYINANHSYTYGIELINKLTVTRMWDMVANLNIFNAKIDGGSNDISSQRVSWFAKMNNNLKLPQGISLQLSGNYQAKSVLPNNQNNDGNGRRMFEAVAVGSAQGYIKPTYAVDVAVKKDWKFSGDNTISLTLAMNDIFKTNYIKNYTETPYLTQNTSRIKDPQVGRLTLSWRFGKMDASLFKKKSAKSDKDSSGDSGE